MALRKSYNGQKSESLKEDHYHCKTKKQRHKFILYENLQRADYRVKEAAIVAVRGKEVFTLINSQYRLASAQGGAWEAQGRSEVDLSGKLCHLFNFARVTLPPTFQKEKIL